MNPVHLPLSNCPDSFPFMDPQQMNPLTYITGRPDRRKRFYNSTERAIIDAFKAPYMKAENAAQCRDIAITKVFPPLFTHWEREEGRRLEEDEKKERCQVRIGFGIGLSIVDDNI